MGRPDIVFVVMGGGIVVCAYRGPRGYVNAHKHSGCLTGTDVVPLDISTLSETMRALVYAELRTELPDDVRRDVEQSEWEEADEITPEVEMLVDVDDLDDPDS